MRRVPGVPLQNLDPLAANTSEIEELELSFLRAVRQSHGVGRPAAAGALRALCGCSKGASREHIMHAVLSGVEASQAQARLAFRSSFARSRTPKQRVHEESV